MGACVDLSQRWDINNKKMYKILKIKKNGYKNL